MPNWAALTLRLSGDDTTLDTVRAAFDGDDFNFDRLLPTPDILDRSQSPLRIVEDEDDADPADADCITTITADEQDRRIRLFGAEDWYGWRIGHWGTKWHGAHLHVLVDEPNRIVVGFDTAWDAPRGILTHLTNLGISISGGVIHEDGSEFEPVGDPDDFDRYFVLRESLQIEDTYSWVDRSIEPR